MQSHHSFEDIINVLHSILHSALISSVFSVIVVVVVSVVFVAHPIISNAISSIAASFLLIGIVKFTQFRMEIKKPPESHKRKPLAIKERLFFLWA